MKHKPHWIPISELNIKERKLIFGDEKSGIWGTGLVKVDGKFEWGWKDIQPSHYWSF